MEQEAEADEGTGEMQERKDARSVPVVAHREFAKSDHPRLRSLDNPAVTAQSLAGVHAPPRDPRDDAAPPAPRHETLEINESVLAGQHEVGERDSVPRPQQEGIDLHELVVAVHALAERVGIGVVGGEAVDVSPEGSHKT